MHKYYSALSLASLISGILPVAARNCGNGLEYCGYALRRIGNYDVRIQRALSHAGEPVDPRHFDHSLFRCIGGSNGDIVFVKYCRGPCIDQSGQDGSCGLPTEL
ncbi:hypothetical protein CDD82_7414 [Ophiocordyceps australis]|uniref:Killer toxin Kp4 domain-containing protein n=1 Tax=Ophiocordyceps australis TaxID=1399860 RepID=A0A2C5XVR4_9HYPO|nr:hypothetical protein CDD82_7414 [Ophiocordyceps australis]